jgi:hypothetical protein
MDDVEFNIDNGLDTLDVEAAALVCKPDIYDEINTQLLAGIYLMLRRIESANRG